MCSAVQAFSEGLLSEQTRVSDLFLLLILRLEGQGGGLFYL